MDSLLFLFSLIGVVVIVGWAVMNDRVPDGGKTTGLLAMHHPDENQPDRNRHTARKRRRPR
ncbi:hypothetical protein [Skermanella pratensis]|uniref:hypothetical protein n=1 Tax=Skermanella pratensis TaxID=2233999 RepID=UPI0013012972|nr:hypothetical protein [Skermanella pratensis]